MKPARMLAALAAGSLTLIVLAIACCAACNAIGLDALAPFPGIVLYFLLAWFLERPIYSFWGRRIAGVDLAAKAD